MPLREALDGIQTPMKELFECRFLCLKVQSEPSNCHADDTFSNCVYTQSIDILARHSFLFYGSVKWNCHPIS